VADSYNMALRKIDSDNVTTIYRATSMQLYSVFLKNGTVYFVQGQNSLYILENNATFLLYEFVNPISSDTFFVGEDGIWLPDVALLFLNFTTGNFTLVAGNGYNGNVIYGKAVNTPMGMITSVAVHEGFIYIIQNGVIDVISPTGTISPFFGSYGPFLEGIDSSSMAVTAPSALITSESIFRMA